MKPHRLEVALRVKTDGGTLLAEHIIREDRVELITYFPAGQIHKRMEVSIDRFIEELEKVLKEKE